MSEKCGNCESSDLGPDRWDIWHYAKTCNRCGTITRYNRRRKIVDVIVKRKNEETKPINPFSYKERLSSNELSSGRLRNFSGHRSIDYYSGGISRSIDQFNNIKDSNGNIKGHIDSFGNVRDTMGKLTGRIDGFGNFYGK